MRDSFFAPSGANLLEVTEFEIYTILLKLVQASFHCRTLVHYSHPDFVVYSLRALVDYIVHYLLRLECQTNFFKEIRGEDSDQRLALFTHRETLLAFKTLRREWTYICKRYLRDVERYDSTAVKLRADATFKFLQRYLRETLFLIQVPNIKREFEQWAKTSLEKAPSLMNRTFDWKIGRAHV